MISGKNPSAVWKTSAYPPVMTEERVSLGPKIRAPFKDYLDALIAELGQQRGMQQWCVEAALTMFYEADKDRQVEYLTRVRNADLQGGATGVISEIKAKRARGVTGKPVEGIHGKKVE